MKSVTKDTSINKFEKNIVLQKIAKEKYRHK